MPSVPAVETDRERGPETGIEIKHGLVTYQLIKQLAPQAPGSD